MSALFLVGFGTGAILASALTAFLADCLWRHEAVNQGHAEYYLDENHKRQWRWKDR